MLEPKRPAKLGIGENWERKEGRHAANMGICILGWICRNFVLAQLGGRGVLSVTRTQIDMVSFCGGTKMIGGRCTGSVVAAECGPWQIWATPSWHTYNSGRGEGCRDAVWERDVAASSGTLGCLPRKRAQDCRHRQVSWSCASAVRARRGCDAEYGACGTSRRSSTADDK